MWQPVDTQFDVPQLPVSIVRLLGAQQGSGDLLRLIVETLDCIVLTHAPGTPLDFLKTIAVGEDSARYMIILGHGTANGIWFGHYNIAEDTSMLHEEYLPVAVMQQHVNLPGCTVINACAESNCKPIADAFLRGGVAAYIACQTPPAQMPMHIFIYNFINGVLRKRLSDRDAWQYAASASDDENVRQIHYFHPDGNVERL